jgi:hypothetical protein
MTLAEFETVFYSFEVDDRVALAVVATGVVVGFAVWLIVRRLTRRKGPPPLPPYVLRQPKK